MKINNYCLYYIPKTSDSVNDVLMIYFGENKVINKRELKDDVIYLYKDNEVVGYVLTNFSSVCKIKINGTIFLPNDLLIDVINNYLSSHHINDLLEYKNHSGYYVGKIINKVDKPKSFIYDVDIGNEVIKSESTFEIPTNQLVVIALDKTYLLPARMIQKYETKDKEIINGRICTYEDLQMDVNNAYLPLLIYEDNLEVGSDFFYTKEKNDDRARA